jgi:thiol-disulfide isomerase/thioredoxin
MYIPENNYRCPNCNAVAKTDLNPADFKRQAARRSALNPNILIMALILVGVAILAFVMISRGGGTTETDDNPESSNTAYNKQINEQVNRGQDSANDNNNNNSNNPVIDGKVGELDIGYVVNNDNPGEMMQITEFIQGDQITIFDFYSEYCPPCRRIAPLLKQLDKKRKDIVVFKVDINRPNVRGIDWKSPLAQQYYLKSIPHFKIYNADGVLDMEGEPAYKQIERFLRSEGIIR